LPRPNVWLKRLSVPFLWAAGGLILAAMVLSHIAGLNVLANSFYLAAFVPSGVPVLLRAVQALRFIDRFAKYDTPAVAVLAALYAQLKEVPAKEIFQQLRQVTGDYTVPEDACPTYAKTYQLLAELDKAFG